MRNCKARLGHRWLAWWHWSLLGGLALTLPAQAQNSVYRCTDAQGKVSYQAQPCPDKHNSKRMELDLPPGGGPAPGGSVNGGARTFAIAADASAPVAPDEAQPPQAAPAPRPARVRPLGSAPPVTPTPTPTAMAAWGKEADVLVLSAYEVSSPRTQVHVVHPDRPVLLVLSSYQGTQWQVLTTPGTRIKAVVHSAHDGSSTVEAPPGVPVVRDSLPYAYETANINFRTLIRQLHARYGVDKVTGLRGSYRLAEALAVAGPFAPDPALTLAGIRPETPRVPMNFDLISADGRRIAWTNAGPKDGQLHLGAMRDSGSTSSMVVSEGGNEAFALAGNGSELRWHPQGGTGPFTKVEPPRGMPELSWGSGLAWDTRRGILALVSFGGEGYFYRYDTRARKWLDARSLKDRDLMGLSQRPGAGGYVSLSHRIELVFLSEQGEVQGVRPLAQLLPDLYSTFDRGNRQLDGLTLVAQEKAIALAHISEGCVTHIWTYEIASGKAQLTYKLQQ